MKIKNQVDYICKKLKIDDEGFIEIEAKHRLGLKQEKDLKSFIEKIGAKHKHSVSFFDQYIDTPNFMLFKKGASLRIRYKQHGRKVYLQYKGPGFLKDGILYRPEFNSGNIADIVLQEEPTRHTVQFIKRHFLSTIISHIPADMVKAMHVQLGPKILKEVSIGHLICSYTKDKFIVDYKNVQLEPSIDKIYSFFISKKRIHPMLTFCEYENEIKSENKSLKKKIDNISKLLAFDRKVVSKLDLKEEHKDKYHRCMSFFIKNEAANGKNNKK